MQQWDSVDHSVIMHQYEENEPLGQEHVLAFLKYFVVDVWDNIIGNNPAMAPDQLENN